MSNQATKRKNNLKTLRRNKNAKRPLFDKRLEEAVIMVLTIKPEYIYSISWLEVADFYFDTNRHIYSCILNLKEKGEAIDVLTITYEAERLGLIANQKLSPADVVTVSSSQDNMLLKERNLKEHAKKLRELRLRRDTLELAERLINEADNPTVDIVNIRKRVIAEVSSKTVNSLLVVQSMDDTMKAAMDAPPLVPTAGGLMNKGDLTFIFGPSGVGKSIFSMQLAQSLASGQSVFEFLPNEGEAGKVLYLDWELRLSQLRKRYTNDQDEFYQFDKNFYRIYKNPDFRDYTSDYSALIIEQIYQAVQAQKPDHVFIDNLTALSSGDLKDSKVALPIMKALNGMKDDFGCSVNVLGHTPKLPTDQPITKYSLSGSVVLTDLADNVIAINKSFYDPDLYYIKQLKGRGDGIEYDENNVLCFNIKKDNCFLKYEFLREDVEMNLLKILDDDAKPEDIQEEIYRLKSKENMSYREIAERLNISRSHTWVGKQYKKYKKKIEAENTFANSLEDARPKVNDEDIPF